MAHLPFVLLCLPQLFLLTLELPAFPVEVGTEGQATVYHPAAPGEIDPVVVSVRFRAGMPDGFPDGFVGRFRQIGADVDPTLHLDDVMPLTAAYEMMRLQMRPLAWGLAFVTTSVLLLSAAGIYALMSFTVAHRTREVGIRAALGAQPRCLLFSAFGRVLRQLALGVLVGSLISAGILSVTTLTASEATYLLVAVATIVLLVGLIAAAGPARRGFGIHASDALRADA